MIRDYSSFLFLQVLLYLFVFTNLSYDTASAQVRNTTWGSSVEEVKEALGKPNLEERKSTDKIVFLASQETTAGKETYVAYYFVDDKLAKIRVLYMNPSMTITEFESISNQITSKYGSPYKENENWHDDTWKDDDNELDYAIRMGDVTISKSWKTEDTLVQFGIGRSNSGVTGQVIEYVSLELAETFNNAISSDF
ncbi:hypothetical protein G3570_07805 [Balneolaceae bacterium YR4-1]|uniref:Uncharacterized protein n=1 Tax=Halalkalibaculum roseum TaxID=2709311 RepID=A0A6M1SUQ6_9BACT|nr:hypothetical protein [Halalkalibaculum roseum]NGP76532.1 hypothetical protein [Halalkalibaculum roseum]